MKNIYFVSFILACLLLTHVTHAETSYVPFRSSGDVANTENIPVSGDITNANITNNKTKIKISLSDYLDNGPVNIKDYCGNINIGNQSGDAACVQEAVDSIGRGKILEFYGNTVWNRSLIPDMFSSSLSFVKFNGFVLNPPGVTDPLSGSGVDDIIPDAVVFNTGSNYASTQPGYERYSSPNKDHSYTPMFQFRQMNDGPSSNQQGSEVVRVSATSSIHSSGNMDGLRTYLRSSGLNYAGSFDVNTWSSTQSYGTNWLWDHITEMANAVPYYCPPEASGHSNICIEYDMNELDMDMLGPEKPESAYDPSKATRGVFGAGGGYSAVNIDNGKHVAWTANTPYNQYQVVVVKNANGKPYMFYSLHKGVTDNDPLYGFVGSVSGSTLTVTSKTHDIVIGDLIFSAHINKEVKIIAQLTGASGDVGTYQVQDLTATKTDLNIPSESMNERAHGNWSTSGSTAPSWTFHTGDTITDGTTVWTCIGPFVADVGVVLKFSGGNSPSTGYVARFGTLLETDTLWCYNALIDFSTALFDPSLPYDVDMRVKPDTYFDFSDKATSSTQNLHLLGFKSLDNTLEYLVNGSRIFGLSDKGTTTSRNIDVIQSLYLGKMTKAQILELPSPQEGQLVFDINDHVTVLYTCKSGTNCGWYPLQMGKALSK